MAQVPWEEFKQACERQEPNMAELAVFAVLEDYDDKLTELLDTSSVSLEVDGVRYVLQLVVTRE